MLQKSFLFLGQTNSKIPLSQNHMLPGLLCMRRGNRIRAGALNFFRKVLPASAFNSAVFVGVIPVGTAFGHWMSKLVALPQLKRLATGRIPWTPLRKPLSESKVVLISTGGVHLESDPPFNLNGDPSFRVIPKETEPADIAISHQAYDRTDALRDINLVFPIERLRELEAEHVIGSLADEHYGFGLMPSAKGLMSAIQEVAQRISDAVVDLALLVPA
jgi:D-proline reductase (dithiol) PrdB